MESKTYISAVKSSPIFDKSFAAAFFDKFTIAFVEWLKERTPRTLEHSTAELLEMYREYIETAPDKEQVG